MYWIGKTHLDTAEVTAAAGAEAEDWTDQEELDDPSNDVDSCQTEFLLLSLTSEELTGPFRIWT